MRSLRKRDPLTDAIASMILRTMLERGLRTRQVLGSVHVPRFGHPAATPEVSRRQPTMECRPMKCLTILFALSTCLTACDFPRPADVPGTGNDAGTGSDAATGSDGSPGSEDGPTSTACCVTADECAKIGSITPLPCPFGACVQNACTTTAGVCDGDEDCRAPMSVCVAGGCAVCRSDEGCPSSKPVCDTIAHDCRTCRKDDECASGACDLAAGTCVDPAAIRYASPAGTGADACTRNAPCSLSHAAALVDATHEYIVLLPGSHTSGATFEGPSAIVAGNSSTIDLASSMITVRNGATVRVRDTILIAAQFLNVFGSRDAISVEGGSSLVIDNMQATLMGVNAIRNGGVLTLRTSTIRGNIIDFGPMIVDRSTIASAQVQFFLSGASFEISNSLFIDDAISINQDGASNQDGALILNNTFINGSIACQGATQKHFESNIFSNTTVVTSSDCLYSYSLFNPGPSIAGVGNKTGDPLFVDPS